MDEESEVRGCYNITFNYTNQLELTTGYCRDTGGKRARGAQRTSFNTLDNWGQS